jgi:hypothetical protein
MPLLLLADADPEPGGVVTRHAFELLAVFLGEVADQRRSLATRLRVVCVRWLAQIGGAAASPTRIWSGVSWRARRSCFTRFPTRADAGRHRLMPENSANTRLIASRR